MLLFCLCRQLKQVEEEVKTARRQILDELSAHQDALDKYPRTIEILSSLKIPEGSPIYKSVCSHGLPSSSDSDQESGGDRRLSLHDFIVSQVTHLILVLDSGVEEFACWF